MPVQLVFAGKAHPHDRPGKEVLQQIARLMRHPRFAGSVLFYVLKAYIPAAGGTSCDMGRD
jgi:glucan phosphorylase